jgi:DnaK suppressor protein
MAVMKDLNLAALETQIRERREALVADVRQHLHRADDPDKLALLNHMEEVGDWVEADLLNELDIAQLRHEVEQLRAVDAALARIKAGTYGVCAECGETIALERLHAYPTAQTCVSCQKELEHLSTSVQKHSL